MELYRILGVLGLKMVPKTLIKLAKLFEVVAGDLQTLNENLKSVYTRASSHGVVGRNNKNTFSSLNILYSMFGLCFLNEREGGEGLGTRVSAIDPTHILAAQPECGIWT